MRTSQPFYDANFLNNRTISHLPEMLRPKPGGLQPHQLRVYEDFLRIQRPPVPRSFSSPPDSSEAQGQQQTQQVQQILQPPSPPLQSPTSQGAQASLQPTGPTSGIVSPPGSSKIDGSQRGLDHVVQHGTVNQEAGHRRTGLPPHMHSESLSPQTPSENGALVWEKLKLLLKELEKAIMRFTGTLHSLSQLPPEHEFHQYIKQVVILLSQTPNPEEAALNLAQDIFNQLYETDSKLIKEMYFIILDHVKELSKVRIQKALTSWLLYSDDDSNSKLGRDVTFNLIRNRLIFVPDLDIHLAKLFESGRGPIDFCFGLIKQMIVEARIISPHDLAHTIDILTKIAPRLKYSESLLKLLERARTTVPITEPYEKREKLAEKPLSSQLSGMNAGLNSTPPNAANSNIQPANNLGPNVSPPVPGFGASSSLTSSGDLNTSLRQQLSILFEEWTQLYHSPNQNEKALAVYIGKLQQQGLLKFDESPNKFFGLCAEICVDTATDKNGNPNNGPVDAFAKLVVLLVKFFPDVHSKMTLLTSVMAAVVQVLMRDHDNKKNKFNERPFFRLFANWLIDLNAPDHSLEAIHMQVLVSFSNTFLMLNPTRYPGFTFAWLELISHRMFMPKLLNSKIPKGWALFQRLLVELFKFLEPYLRIPEFTEPIKLLYKGTLRVLLVLLHDFPEFLCDYHFSFCDVIPPSCIQMRNLILSAYPRNMRLPDPFTPNLKVDLLPEINQAPRILSNYTAALQQNNFKQEIDNYLKTRSSLFLIDLRNKLLLSAQEAMINGTKYNVPLINALVLYTGVQAISQFQNKSSQVAPPSTHSAPMDIFQHLASELDTEGRYLFLNALANQLRYPNNHTHYFSCVLLYLFDEANQGSQEIIQEQITRVLLERLNVNRPHPWGLLITFIELIKNPRYRFWSHSFTRCAAEIERLFDAVARSCMGPQKLAPVPQTEPLE